MPECRDIYYEDSPRIYSLIERSVSGACTLVRNQDLSGLIGIAELKQADQDKREDGNPLGVAYCVFGYGRELHRTYPAPSVPAQFSVNRITLGGE